MPRLRYLVIAAVAALGLASSFGTTQRVGVETAPAPAHLTAASSGGAYTWHGYDFTVCGEIYVSGCSSASLWRATDHVAFWSNGTSAVMATGSGFPYCTSGGYNITVTGCTWHGGGYYLYAVLSWQNCVLAFNVGCFNDFVTLTYNAKGQFVSWHEDWPDAYP